MPKLFSIARGPAGDALSSDIETEAFPNVVSQWVETGALLWKDISESTEKRSGWRVLNLEGKTWTSEIQFGHSCQTMYTYCNGFEHKCTGKPIEICFDIFALYYPEWSPSSH